MEEIQATNPATGEVIGAFARSGPAEVDAAVETAAQAQREWRTIDPLERARLVTAIAQAVEAHAEELALLDVADNGSPIREMRRDAHIAATQLRYFAGLALQLRGDTVPTGFDRLNYTLPEPFGVVGRIIPFNHPLMFAAGRLGAPLIAGNAVILKPSEHTSLSALRLAELIDPILPAGLVQVVTGYGAEAGDALAAHPGVRRLSFIGSAAIGRQIQARAASQIVKTVTLELGGKNPIVVFPDADLDLAVDGALRGMNFTWQGQSCGSTSRLLVHESEHDGFVEALGERIDALKSGPPADESTDTGAIVHQGQYDKVVDYLRIGRDEGARVVVGGSAGPGPFIRPTLFDNVKPGSRLAQEEIFGPVLAAMPFDGYDEALAIANSVSYGLTASVFTRDLGTAHRFARDVQAGYVWVNDASRHFPGTAYGGVKDSGVGRDEGWEELLSFSQIKNVNVRL
jgi:betaine-aldehyde dehydrogenase